MRKNKKKIAIALSAVMIGTLGTVKVQAEDRNTITLPVQFYDFDGDGLFYEYALYNGMDTFGLGESNNEDVTVGLVKNELNEDGLPVYTKKAIKAAAKTIHENLLSQKSNPDVTKYSTFREFANTVPASGTAYDKVAVLGENDNWFYGRWKLEGQTAVGSSGELHTGKGTVWEQETDDVVNYGVQDTLTKEISVEPNVEYKCSRWCDNNDLKFQIVDANGLVLVDNTDGAEFTSATNTVKFIVSRVGNASTRGKFAVAKIFPNGQSPDDYPNLLGNSSDETDFLSEGWTSENYDSSNSSVGNGKIIDGTTYWKQVGDGVACLSDSSIVMDTDIPANQYVNIHYFLGYNGYRADGITIDLLDETDKVLSHNTLKDTEGGEYTLVGDATGGTGNVKIRINGKAGSRIAAVKIAPVGSVLPLGKYKTTVAKYKAGNLNTVDDCENCMDYAYLRLANYFNTDFYLNTKENKYNTLVLKSNIKDDGTIEYTFDSSKEVTYDTDGTFYNTDNGEDVSGFFPLDYTGNEHLSDGNQENPLDHNYHFGMKVDGDFIYQEGANQFFNFSGDDDVYVFINGKLAVDLGGAHKEVSNSLDIEQYAKDNGIKNGEKCRFQMFYLERHTTASNCKIQTNLKIGNHPEYKFVSKTEGMELPEEINNMTPIDEDTYYDGQTVTNKEYNKKYSDVYDEINKGCWKFVEWDKESETNTDETVKFTGYWEFVKDDYKVIYEFISGTEGKDLPEEVKKLTPSSDKHLAKDDKVNADNDFSKEVKVTGGKWTFVNWDTDSVTITDHDEKFTGTWVFTADTAKGDDEIKNPGTKDPDSGKTDAEKPDTKKEAVNTADHSNVTMYAGIGLFATIGFWTVVLFRKKHN